VKRLKGGPELKLPELKVPPVLVDLYWDLRDRRLLPLVGLAIVAIVAVPFLLGGSKDEPPPAAPIVSAPSPEPASSRLTVVEAKPGLRDPGKRLRDASPTDPFVQRYNGPVLKGTQLGGGKGDGGASKSSTTSTSTSTTTVTTKKTSGSGTTEVTTKTTGGESGSPESSSPGSGSEASPHLTLYSFAVDVKIIRTATTADGGKDRSEPEVRQRVVPPAALPSEKEQVVTYMGISPKTRAPMLLISDAVTAVFGEAKCLSGASTCQLIEVEPGMPMTFVYGPDSVRFKITVLKVEPVVTGHN
jgi:hypothetical protein